MMSYRSNFIPVQWSLAELWPWTLKFGQIFSFLISLLHYDLIYWLDFLVCVYNHKLQINFEIRSSWMIFCQLTVVGFWNSATYLVVTTFFHYDLRYWLGMWVYWWVTDQVLVSFRLNDFGLIYAPWTINFGQIFSCHYALRYWLDFLVFEIIMTSLLNIDGRGIDKYIFFFFFFVENNYVHIGEKFEYTVYLFHKQWHCISIYVQILYIPSAVYLSLPLQLQLYRLG